MVTQITDKPGRHGSVRRTYTYRSEWAGYSLTRSARGWIVETWSAVQGEMTGTRVLVPYGLGSDDLMVRQGHDPDAPINDSGTTYGQWLVHMSGSPKCRTLRRGLVVS